MCHMQIHHKILYSNLFCWVTGLNKNKKRMHPAFYVKTDWFSRCMLGKYKHVHRRALLLLYVKEVWSICENTMKIGKSSWTVCILYFFCGGSIYLGLQFSITWQEKKWFQGLSGHSPLVKICIFILWSRISIQDLECPFLVWNSNAQRISSC